MPKLVGRTSTGGYLVQADGGQVMETAVLPPGVNDPTAPAPLAIPDQTISATPPTPDAGFWQRAQGGIDRFKAGLSSPPRAPTAEQIDAGVASGRYDQTYADALRRQAGIAPSATTLPEQTITPGSEPSGGPAIVPYRPGMSSAGGGGRQQQPAARGGGGASRRGAEAPEPPGYGWHGIGMSAAADAEPTPNASPAEGGGVGGSPVGAAPPGMVRASVSTQREQLDPETMKRLGLDEDVYAKAAGDTVQAQSEGMAKLGEEKGRVAGQLANNDRWDRASEQSRAQKAQEAFDKLGQVQNAYASGSYVDEGYEKAGGKFLVTLGMALGAGANALLGKDTGVVSALQNKVNTYIDEARDKAKSKVSGQQNLIAHLDKQFGNERAADSAARIMFLDEASKNLDALVTTNSSQELQAKKAEIQAQLNVARDKEMLGLTKITTAEHYALPKPTGAGGMVAPKSDGSYVNLPDGTAIKAKDPEGAAKWAEQLGSAKTVQGSVDQISSLLDSPSAGADVGKIKAGLNTISNLIGPMFVGTTRASAQGELKRLDEILAPGETVTSDARGQIRAALKFIRGETARIEQDIMGRSQRYSWEQPDQKGEMRRVPLQAPRQPGAAPNAGGQVAFTPAGSQ